MRRLLMVTGMSALLLGLAACASTPGPRNSSTEALDAVGLWGTKTQGEPWLEIAADGSLVGHDGCNHLGGSWTQNLDRITFGAMRSTMMFCEGVDTWLTAADHAVLIDGKLEVRNSLGNAVGTLSRSS